MKACLRISTGALIKVSRGSHRNGQWAMVPRLEAALWMASSATTFVKPNLNYLHGTPQSLDQAVLAVTVTTTKKKRGKKEERHKIGYRIERRGPIGNFILR